MRIAGADEAGRTSRAPLSQKDENTYFQKVYGASWALYGDCVPCDERRSSEERRVMLGMRRRVPGKAADLQQTLAQSIRHNLHIATGEAYAFLRDGRIVLASDSMTIRREVWKKNHVMFRCAPKLGRALQSALRRPEDLEEVARDLEELGPERAARRYKTGTVLSAMRMQCGDIKGSNWEKWKARQKMRALAHKRGGATGFCTLNGQPDQDAGLLRYIHPLGRSSVPWTEDLLDLAAEGDDEGLAVRGWGTVDLSRMVPPLPDAYARMAATRENYVDVNEVLFYRFSAMMEIGHACHGYDAAEEGGVGDDGFAADFLRGCGMEGYVDWHGASLEVSRKGPHIHYVVRAAGPRDAMDVHARGPAGR